MSHLIERIQQAFAEWLSELERLIAERCVRGKRKVRERRRLGASVDVFRRLESLIGLAIIYLVVLGFLLTQGAAVLVGFVMHEGLHLWTALTQGVSAGSVKAGWLRFWVLAPVEVGVYRRIVLAPLMLPALVGLLLAVVAPPRLALSAALLWLLGSADDLADWVRLWGVSGAVTHRPGKGLRLEVER